MIRRFLALVFLWPLAVLPAVAADFGAPGDGFELKGVLISPNSRSALVNGSIAQVGDRVAGAEIVAIEPGKVRIWSRSAEIIVEVGGNLDSGMVLPDASPDQYRVRRGDTLSEIAERYLVEGATLNQTMMALFEANGHAFDGNINRLKAGAVLRVPGENELFGRSPETALAAVLEHVDRWKSGVEYGPVANGETLSGIAVRLLPEGESLDSMMSAIFEENRHAFGEDIDFLREGAVLRIPDAYARRRQVPEIEQLAALIR